MFGKEAMRELKEYAVISKVDRKQKFFLGVPTECRVKTDNKTIRAIDKCKTLRRKHFKNNTVRNGVDKLSLLVMTDGGKDLKIFAKEFERLSHSADTIKKVKLFWIEAHRLFRGILTFQKYGILHHDIKPHNLVYNQKTNRINFIDFGHMRDKKSEMVKCEASDGWIYDYPFWNYPFEIQFFNKRDFMNFANKTKEQKEQFMLHFIQDLKTDTRTKFTDAFQIFMEYILTKKPVSSEKAISDKYLLEFRKMITEEIRPANYKPFLKASIDTIDVYGLGMSMQYVLGYMGRHMDITTVKKMESCFFFMTTPNLVQRYSCQEAIDAYETILIESGYLDTYKIIFDNHVPRHVKNTNRVERSLRRSHSKYWSADHLDKAEFDRSREK